MTDWSRPSRGAPPGGCGSNGSGARTVSASARKRVSRATLARLAIRSPWILFRSNHAFHALGAGSGRARTVWRPHAAQLGARLLGRRIEWVENEEEKARTWTLRLPAGD
jgi:hypothetical protein